MLAYDYVYNAQTVVAIMPSRSMWENCITKIDALEFAKNVPPNVRNIPED